MSEQNQNKKPQSLPEAIPESIEEIPPTEKPKRDNPPSTPTWATAILSLLGVLMVLGISGILVYAFAPPERQRDVLQAYDLIVNRKSIPTEVVRVTSPPMTTLTATVTASPTVTPSPTVTASPTTTPSPTNTPTPTLTPTPDIAPVMINRLIARSELVTTELSVATIRLNVTTRQGPANSCGRSGRYAVEATFRAGVDLTNLTDASVNYDAATDTYTLMVPPVQLLNCQIDELERYVLTGPVGLTCSRDESVLDRLANYNAVNALRDEILSEGFLLQVEQDTEAAIVGLLGGVTTSNIRVSYSGNIPPLPENCAPLQPNGWNYVNGEWIPAP
jgi:hypothetical protein